MPDHILLCSNYAISHADIVLFISYTFLNNKLVHILLSSISYICHVYMCICMYVCMYACVCMCVCMCIYVYIYIYIIYTYTLYIHIHYIYIYIYTHKHTHDLILWDVISYAISSHLLHAYSIRISYIFGIHMHKFFWTCFVDLLHA